MHPECRPIYTISFGTQRPGVCDGEAGWQEWAPGLSYFQNPGDERLVYIAGGKTIV
jgi:hypothetical protein